MNNRRTFCIIRAVYENVNFNQNFEYELDQALASGVSLIIVEPEELGLRTKQWIYLGNNLHRSIITLATGSISFLALYLFSRWRHSLRLNDVNDIPGDITSSLVTWGSISLGLTSGIFAIVYSLCWHMDPCCNYQVDSASENSLDYSRSNFSADGDLLSTTNNTSTDYPSALSISPRLPFMSLHQPVLLRWKSDKHRFWSHNVFALLSGGAAFVWLYLKIRKFSN